MKQIIFFIFILLFGTLDAQVAINQSGVPPDSSAMLDVNSTTRGILVPRMDSVHRKAINNPAQGLIVYDTDDSTFYYFKNNSWFKIGSYYSQWHEHGNYIYTYDSVGIGTTSPGVSLVVNGLISQTGTGHSVFLGEGAGFKNETSPAKDNTAVGYMALYNNTSGKYNVAIGDSTLYSNRAGNYNTAVGVGALKANYNADNNSAVGWKALSDNYSGNNNTAIGALSLKINVSGNNNTAVGDSALYNNREDNNAALGAASLTANYSGNDNVAGGYGALWANYSGDYNTAFGYKSLFKNYSGEENTAFGDYTLFKNVSGRDNTVAGSSALMTLVSGDYNTVVGKFSGRYLVAGNGNIFIGNEAGYNQSGSNKLFISNNTNNTPLIGGDFSLNEIYLNGRVGIGTMSPNEFLEVANTNLSGSHSARMIVSDGKGAQRRVLLFVSPNHNDSDTNARIEAYNYGSGKGCNLEINRVGHGKTEMFGSADVNGIIRVSSSTIADNAPQAGMIRWNAVEQDFEGYNGTQWLSLSNVNGGWGTPPDVQEDTAFSASDGVSGDKFGHSVSASNQFIFVGAHYKNVGGNSQEGQVYVFHQGTATSWNQQAIINASDGSANDHFGCSVSVWENNSTMLAIVGAEGANSNTGKAYVYKYNNGNWVQKAILTATDGTTYNYFGCSVAISNNYLIVGAYGKNNYQGKAYIYFTNDNGETWHYAISLTASDGTSSDKFGKSVSVFSDVDTAYNAIVGAFNKTVNGNTAQGAAYLFHGSYYSGNQVAILTSSDGASGDNFGTSVSISGDYSIIGAEHKNISNATQQGKVYIFKHNTSGWIEYANLIASDGSANDNFGHSVSISDVSTDYYAIVGSDNKSSGGYSHLGKAYIYFLADTVWEEKAKIIPSDKEQTYCGTSVSIYDDHAIIGCYNKKVCYVRKK